MRCSPVLLVLLLAACGDDGMTRSFSTSRVSAPETVAATQVPLSTPPGLALRPIQPNTLTGSPADTQSPDQAPGSAGQDALLEASGPSADPSIRAAISENAGLAYPGPVFVDRLMTWTPPPGYTPVFTQARSGGWFSRLF